MTDRTITLGGIQLVVAPIPLGRLKRLLPTFCRVGAGLEAKRFDEATIGGLIEIIADGTGKTIDEVEAIPATLHELVIALGVVAEVAGLIERGAAPGGAPPAAAAPSTSTSSTAG
jgi:hypothetical protein